MLQLWRCAQFRWEPAGGLCGIGVEGLPCDEIHVVGMGPLDSLMQGRIGDIPRSHCLVRPHVSHLMHKCRSIGAGADWDQDRIAHGVGGRAGRYKADVSDPNRIEVDGVAEDSDEQIALLRVQRARPERRDTQQPWHVNKSSSLRTGIV